MLSDAETQKGCVLACQTLMQGPGLDFSMVERIIHAGGFGRYLNIEKSIGIGLATDRLEPVHNINNVR